MNNKFRVGIFPPVLIKECFTQRRKENIIEIGKILVILSNIVMK